MPASSSSSEPSILLRIKSQYDLAEFLGVSKAHLNYLGYKIRDQLYTDVQIPKKRGGLERRISVPRPPLRRIQWMLSREFANVYRPTNIANAYVRGRSIRRNVRVHVGKNHLCCIDLEDFFGHIHWKS